MLFHASVISIPNVQALMEACHVSAACLLFSHSIYSRLFESAPACLPPRRLQKHFKAQLLSFFLSLPRRPPQASRTIVSISFLASQSLLGSGVMFLLGAILRRWQRILFLQDGPNADPPQRGNKTLTRKKNLSQHHCFIRIWHENCCILTVHQCLTEGI